VVSKTIGAEGLHVVHGESILIADDAEAFAEAVLTLLQSPEARGALATHARELLVRSYSWESVTANFLDLSLSCIPFPTAPH
jgi:glycosyltransferase involved in cell wall biosynthesis